MSDGEALKAVNWAIDYLHLIIKPGAKMCPNHTGKLL